MSTASFTQATTVPASALAYPGKVGQTPIAPAVHFREAGGYRNFVRTLFGVAAFFAVLGVVTMITIGGPAWMFLVLAPPFALWGWDRSKRQMHMDCVCDESGMTVRVSRGRTPLPSVFIAWALVEQTNCRTITNTSTDENSGTVTKSEYLIFRVLGGGQNVDIDATRVSNIAGLITFANRSTPQLDYMWVLAADARNRRVLANGGKYLKVAR